MVTTRAQMSKQISKPGRKKKPKIPKKYLAGLSTTEKAKRKKEINKNRKKKENDPSKPVSYTHLTLPTIYSV